jgi:hypothetical protein
MSTHQIQTRLRKLEARIQSRPLKPNNLISFLRWLWIISLMYYLGQPEPDEAIPSAYALRCARARALNFESYEDYQNASEETLDAHLGRAVNQLLAKFGVTLNDNVDRLVEAGKQMLAGLSEPYKEQLQKAVRYDGVEWLIEFAQLARVDSAYLRARELRRANGAHSNLGRGTRI